MQKRSVTVLAPAKLNLSLDVVGTLPNGYHDLDMVMQTIDLYEKIILKTSRDLRLSLPGSFVPANDKNTAIKAALAFFQYTGLLAGVGISTSTSGYPCAPVWRAAAPMPPVCWWG